MSPSIAPGSVTVRAARTTSSASSASIIHFVTRSTPFTTPHAHTPDAIAAARKAYSAHETQSVRIWENAAAGPSGEVGRKAGAAYPAA